MHGTTRDREGSAACRRQASLAASASTITADDQQLPGAGDEALGDSRCPADLDRRAEREPRPARLVVRDDREGAVGQATVAGDHPSASGPAATDLTLSTAVLDRADRQPVIVRTRGGLRRRTADGWPPGLHSAIGSLSNRPCRRRSLETIPRTGAADRLRRTFPRRRRARTVPESSR